MRKSEDEIFLKYTCRGNKFQIVDTSKLFYIEKSQNFGFLGMPLPYSMKYEVNEFDFAFMKFLGSILLLFSLCLFYSLYIKGYIEALMVVLLIFSITILPLNIGAWVKTDENFRTLIISKSGLKIEGKEISWNFIKGVRVKRYISGTAGRHKHYFLLILTKNDTIIEFALNNLNLEGQRKFSFLKNDYEELRHVIALYQENHLS